MPCRWLSSGSETLGKHGLGSLKKITAWVLVAVTSPQEGLCLIRDRSGTDTDYGHLMDT